MSNVTPTEQTTETNETWYYTSQCVCQPVRVHAACACIYGLCDNVKWARFHLDRQARVITR